jgi:hypothetical protein
MIIFNFYFIRAPKVDVMADSNADFDELASMLDELANSFTSYPKSEVTPSQIQPSNSFEKLKSYDTPIDDAIDNAIEELLANKDSQTPTQISNDTNSTTNVSSDDNQIDTLLNDLNAVNVSSRNLISRRSIRMPSNQNMLQSPQESKPSAEEIFAGRKSPPPRYSTIIKSPIPLSDDMDSKKVDKVVQNVEVEKQVNGNEDQPVISTPKRIERVPSKDTSPGRPRRDSRQFATMKETRAKAPKLSNVLDSYNIAAKSFVHSRSTQSNYTVRNYAPISNRSESETSSGDDNDNNNSDNSNSSSEPPMPPTPTWKEYTSSSGKKYYYNTVTKKSTWERPSVFDVVPTSNYFYEDRFYNLLL